jgi:hypothetical protein
MRRILLTLLLIAALAFGYASSETAHPSDRDAPSQAATR